MEEEKRIKFLGLQTDNHLNQKCHVELSLLKCSETCFAKRSLHF